MTVLCLSVICSFVMLMSMMEMGRFVLLISWFGMCVISNDGMVSACISSRVVSFCWIMSSSVIRCLALFFCTTICVMILTWCLMSSR